jgi:6-methylsalicylate decarboxylase
MLSLTAPGIVGWKQNERREMARRLNEYTADLVGKRPDRFGNLATLPPGAVIRVLSARY